MNAYPLAEQMCGEAESGVTQRYDTAINSVVMHTCTWLHWTCKVVLVVNLWSESCNVCKVTIQRSLHLVVFFCWFFFF